MRIAIRSDASSTMGSGHVMRCKTLADELRTRGAEILFICREHPGNLIDMLKKEGYRVAALPDGESAGPSADEDADASLKILDNWKPDWMIVDHYGIAIEWERRIRKQAAKIFVIDDLADRQHDCDLLLDQNAHEDPAGRYWGKIPDTCTRLFGPRYALLRNEFRAAKRHLTRQKGPVGRILVSFGGADFADDTTRVLNMLDRPEFSALEADIVIGPGHRNKNEIASLCSRNPSRHLHCGTQDMAGLMAGADLAIGAGGITTWERIYLGLPAFARATAPNQVEALEYLARLGQIKLWRDTDELAELLASHLASGIELPPFDIHFGTSEVAERIFPCTELVPFGVRHVRLTYKWLTSAQLRETFLFATPPTVKSHCRYWRSEFDQPTQAVFAIDSRGRHVGNCGLKHIEPLRKQAELWLYLGENERGRGTGEAALRLLEIEARKRIPNGILFLHVGKANTAAIALYRKTGFSLSAMPVSREWGMRAPDLLRMEKPL